MAEEDQVHETAPELYDQTEESDKLISTEYGRMMIAKNRDHILQTDPAA